MKHLLLAVFLCAAGTLCAQRSWVVEIDTQADIYAVGDAHADYDRLAGVLRAAGLVDAEGKWSGGKSVLVVTGDTIDKGPEEVKTISYLRALQLDAARSGGRLVLTLGNHEAEFLADPEGKKTRDFANGLVKAGLEPKSVAGCGGDLGVFFCSLPVAARVNDWFFSHGGYTAGRSIAQINADVALGFSKERYASEQFVGDDSILEARLGANGPGGLPWFMGGNAKTDPAKLLAAYAAALGVHHIVQGHQPAQVGFPDGVKRPAYTFFQRYGLLFLIDSGMSRGIEGSTGSGGALRIHGNQAEVVYPDGTSRVIWKAE